MFGERLRYWREVAGLTQTQLADRLGYHHTYISKLESGGRRPPSDLARRADELLGAGGDLATFARSDGRWPLTGDPGSIVDPLPGTGFAAERADTAVQHWSARFPVYGIVCPLHSRTGCTASVADTPIAELLGRQPSKPRAAVVHGFAALLAGYSQLNLERATTDIIAPVERCVHAISRAMDGAGKPVALALSSLAAHFADLAGWLRVESGQNGLGMAWFQRGLDWARASDNVPAQCALFARMSGVARLEGDGHSAITYATAAQATDPRRRWAALYGQLHAARGHAQLGDGREFDRVAGEVLTLAERLGERDQVEAPWLCGAEGQTFVSSFLSGGLRDLAKRSGDVRPAARAAELARRSLVTLPRQMYPSRVLLTLRLADSHACAGELDAAVATAGPVVAEAQRVRMALIGRELAGLRARLARGGALTALDNTVLARTRNDHSAVG
ncbi:Helix-turn-helix domain-containing protein [Actinokineospora alba]|uniref:Helix-turn-helix domain-containing protein n=1 Tax=Actinokineospora alba TaxID=504798 RepID=A0A1H0G473_9PSEU|nr:helix-turn-helix transcriptional regulator [Actinokineospora alba]TDP69749.1 helix-turn-helix protein [Actinokineospora alba]SDI09585.1 Helix-turn-helix domain-containing protein [Actinokineospora alba]SDO01539.1 Helix-turn-helix domain-containing protein [Actinokineospora alba]